MNTFAKAPVIGEDRDRQLLEGALSYVYSVDEEENELLAHFFTPPETSDAPVPCLAFFHGGTWDNGNPTQFVPQCLHFAHRGAVSATFEYRTQARHNGTPSKAVIDTQEAILGIKQNAAALNIDPNKIIAIGAGSGAFNVLNVGMSKEALTDGEFDSRPAAVVAYSAIANTTKRGIASHLFADDKEAKNLSPTTLVRKGLPPMLLLHGKADRTVPFEHVERFVKSMRRKKNNCGLVDYEGADHSFFNFNVSESLFELTTQAVDSFLVQLGYFEPSDEEF